MCCAIRVRCAVCIRHVSGAELINFLRTWGEQRTSGAWKGPPAHPVLSVFAPKTEKFRFAANGMQTVRIKHSKGSQSHPHIRAFGSQTVCEWFANYSAHSYIRGFRFAPSKKRLLGLLRSKSGSWVCSEQKAARCLCFHLDSAPAPVKVGAKSWEPGQIL